MKNLNIIFISSLLLLVSQVVLVLLLKKNANEEEDRFKQTRLVSEIFICLIIFITKITHN